MSRAREAEADLEAAELTGDPAGLTSALVKLRQWQERRLHRLFATAHSLHLPTLFDNHPPTEERIRGLMQLLQRDDVGLPWWRWPWAWSHRRPPCLVSANLPNYPVAQWSFGRGPRRARRVALSGSRTMLPIILGFRCDPGRRPKETRAMGSK